jgi:hypothetical protein
MLVDWVHTDGDRNSSLTATWCRAECAEVRRNTMSSLLE